MSRWLRRNRRKFVCLVRPGRRQPLAELEGASLFEGDLTRRETLSALFERYPIRQIIHLAARLLGQDENLFERDNVQATENLIQASRKVPLQRFLFVSTGDVLSRYEGPYSRSKKKAEQKIIESGLPYTILRPFRVNGAGDQSFGRMGQKMKSRSFAAFIGSGKNVWQPFFVEDFCRAILQALDSPQAEGKIYALAGRDRISYRDFLNRLRLLANPRCRLVYLPAPLCFLAVRTACALMPSFSISISNLQNMLEDKTCDFSAAARDFGFDPTPLQDFLPHLNALPSAKNDGISWEKA